MKHISYIRLSALLLSLLVGCTELRTRPPLENPNISVIPVPNGSSTCECPTAEGFNLVNTGSTGSVSILTISRGPSDTVAHQEFSSKTIQAGTTTPLFCSVQPTAAKKCELSVVTVVNGKPYGGDVNTIMQGIVKATASADMEHMTLLPKPVGDCPQKCKDLTHCTKFDVSKSKSVGVGQEIALLLGVSKTLIGNDKIVGLTGSKTNECQRSDVVFEGGQAYNIGLLPVVCQIQTNLPNSLGEVDITVPRTLTFKHTLSPGQNGNFQLNFDLQQAALQLTFTNSTLQTILGGSLLEVDYDAGSFVFEMQSHACLSVQVN